MQISKNRLSVDKDTVINLEEEKGGTLPVM